MNEPKNSAKSDPLDAEDDDDAATKLSELPADLMFPDSVTAPFGVIEPAPEDVQLMPSTMPPRAGPGSVQIRGPGAALSGEDVDVDGETGLIQVPADPANAADAARAAQAQSARNAPPPPFGVVPQHLQHAQQPQHLQHPQHPQHLQHPQHAQHLQYPQHPQHAQHPQPGKVQPASAFAATAYADAPQLRVPNPQPQRVLAAAPSGGGTASGIVWAIGGILVGLALLGIIAIVLFLLLRSGS
jgi:hypothetical protein